MAIGVVSHRLVVRVLSVTPMAKRKPKPEPAVTAEAVTLSAATGPAQEPPAPHSPGMTAPDWPLTPPADDRTSTPDPKHESDTPAPGVDPATDTERGPSRPVGPNPFGVRGDYEAGVRLLEDRRFRQMQLAFAEKPSEAVRQAVRDAGFQWRAGEQVWTLQINPEKGWQTRARAHEAFERAAELLRQELGLARQVG
jgi:hypothetical protein